MPRPSQPGPISAEAIRTATLGYRPNGAGHDRWDEIGPFVRDAVVNGGCTSLSGVYVALKAVSAFADWAASHAMPLDKEAVLDEPTVEHFVAVGLKGISNRSRATYASTLRRVGRLATRRAHWSPEPLKYSHKVLAPPYRGDEVDWMWEIARTQKSPGRTRGALALLSLALCAGLKAHEVGAVRADDVRFRDDAVLVHVRGGRPRTVPVLPRAHAALRSLCEEYEGRQLYADIAAGRTAASQVSRHIEVPPRAPAFDSPRMRTTWLVDMLSTGLTVSEVYLFAGTVSTHALRDLLPYVRTRDEAAIFADIARWNP